jgi:hypothetical protein
VVTIPPELQLSYDLGGKEAHHVGSGGHFEPRPHLFGYSGTTEQVTAFQDERLQSRPAEVRRAYKAVVPSPHDNNVVLPRAWHHAASL